MAAGYSGTPLAKKLGIRAGDTVVLVGAPDGFEAELEGLPDGVTLKRRSGGRPHVVVLFTTQASELARRFEPLAKSIFPDGSLWIAWPKKSSGVTTDVNENRLRDVGLPHGLVDNKVCAVNEVWSGLRFVWRKENR
ncbi:MAG: DUF3052 domain-containing protein [Acidimicrobiia bacterium]|nr:DUF3052 domain-containing protein [Acidimicrobiia bacterium]